MHTVNIVIIGDHAYSVYVCRVKLNGFCASEMISVVVWIDFGGTRLFHCVQRTYMEHMEAMVFGFI